MCVKTQSACNQLFNFNTFIDRKMEEIRFYIFIYFYILYVYFYFILNGTFRLRVRGREL